VVIARGREEIKKAFIAISEYFNHSLSLKQVKK
jgi:ketosteroid isomerase-like protein